MSRAAVRLRLGPEDTTVAIDGHDIAPAVRSLSLSHDGDNRGPVLELDLTWITVDLATEEAVVVLTPATHEALVKLGWTPPPPNGDRCVT